MKEAVVVICTGTANLASVVAAIERTGRKAEVTSDPRRVSSAEQLVLPGVGSFGRVARRLEDLDLAEPIAKRVRLGRPTLAICLGLQLLALGSEEDPGVVGLGVFPTTATRFPDTVRVPQLGWNAVAAQPGCRLLADGAAYFANSYRLQEVPDGWTGALSDHGGQFVAAIERDQVLACQFHPELSGRWGQALIERWLGGAPC